MKKKNLWMLGAAVLTATACSNVDVVKEGAAPQVKAIRFDTHVNKTTRAIANDHFSTFYVCGSYTAKNASNTHYTIFNGQDPVTSKNNQAGPWTYPNTRYWIAGANYRFYAYSNDNGNITAGLGNVAFSEGLFKITDYICNNQQQKDLIFADLIEQEGLETSNPPVSFNFKHILSRLQFEFVTTFSKDNTITISDFRVNNIRDKGTFDPGTVADENIRWTNVNRSTTTPKVEPLFEGKSTAECNSEEGKKAISDFVYVIPFQYEDPNVSVLFDITVKNKEGITILERNDLRASWTPRWEIGKSYLYTVTINGSAAGVDPIVFEVNSITDWGEGDPTLPNIGVDGGKKPQEGA